MARDLPIDYVRIGSLSIAEALHEFIEQEAAPGTSISAEAFWSSFAESAMFCPKGTILLSAPLMSMTRLR